MLFLCENVFNEKQNENYIILQKTLDAPQLV